MADPDLPDFPMANNDRRLLSRRIRLDALREARDRLVSVFDYAPIGMAVVSLEGRYLQVNRSLCEILGHSEDELLATTWQEITHPDDLAASLANARRIIEDTIPKYHLEKRFLHADGHAVWASLSVSLVKNFEGKPLYFVSQIQDITERKNAERKLRETERRYRSLIERAPAVVYIQEIGSPDSALYMSPQIETLTGYSPEDCKDPILRWNMVHPDDRERMQSEDERIGEPGEVFSTEYRVVHRDGRIVWVRNEAIMIEDEVSGSRYWQGFMLDITERKKAEEEIKEANRRLEELAVLRADFTAMVAHELDTPLAVIRGYAEMLATEALKPTEQSRRALDKIQTEAEVLRGLVADVRDAAAFEREDFAIEPQQVSVRALLDEADQGGAVLLGNHPLVIGNAVDDEQVWADPNRIRQVLRNLLSNAAKYSPDNAPIELRAKPGQTPGRIRIEVTDYGYGIHPDDVQRVFEKFGRGRDRYGRKIAGVGLGLYLSRRIMRAHGSDLNISSVPNGGSEFSFDLEAVR